MLLTVSLQSIASARFNQFCGLFGSNQYGCADLIDPSAIGSTQ